ncbi:S8 family peptidase [Microbacterium sp.]|uniref:S8 family peptidase n=1 Tax=Microbacterium sp. TaxID=51671 RepID=UPI003F6E4CAB
MVDDANQDAARTGSWKDDRLRWSILNPAGEKRGSVFSTVYVSDELLVDPTATGDGEDPFGTLEALAARAGWTLEQRPLEEGRDGEARFAGASSTYRVRLGVAPSTGREAAVAETPDAWQLLRQARANGTSAGVSLNHVITTDSFESNPFKMNPFKMNPFKMNPFKMNGTTVGMDTYASPGFGGRQPVAYLGEAPARADVKRRPVVAIFDTGCGRHPWFTPDVMIDPVLGDGEPIGLANPWTDPEQYPSLGRPLEGWLDDAAGHGTFIAGIVRQQSPDAWILPVRIADGEGVILEHELIGALGRLLTLMETSEAEGGRRVDVLNLSFSFFSETPDDPSTVSELSSLLAKIRGHGCVVVCSAGNDATDRPVSPATLGAGDPLHIVVGALNPSRRSVALFSNIGPWVTTWAPGVSIVSTQPTDFDGSIQAGTRDDLYGRRRETLDVDEFRGGFAVWSGTSFAAPVVAGRIAAHLAAGLDPASAVTKVLERGESEDVSRDT